MKRKLVSPLTILTAALLVLALARGAELLLHDPLVGLANNYDMIRVQGCIDAYPMRGDETPPWHNSWRAPIRRYEFRDDIQPGCFRTSEALFAFAALPLLKRASDASSDGGFSLKLIGAVKLAALSIAATGMSLALWLAGSRTGSLGNAAVALVVLFDPGVTIYLNTMYAEFAAIFFGYLAVGSTAVALIRKQTSFPLLVLCFAATVLACASKIQHVAFGAFLLAAVVLVSVRSQSFPRALAGTLLAATLLGAGIQLATMNGKAAESISQANLTNTILQAVLGSSSNPRQTASRLALPARCGDHAGKTWFSPHVQEAHPCPEVFALSRLRLIPLLVLEPETMLRVLSEGLRRTRPWIPPALGKVEGLESAPVPAELASIDHLLSRLPEAAYFAAFALPLLLSAMQLLSPGAPQRPSALAFCMLFCALYPWGSLISVVLGDGFADVAKQFHAGTAALLTYWMLFAFSALDLLLRRKASVAAPGAAAQAAGAVRA